jgi:hypothetical protein
VHDEFGLSITKQTLSREMRALGYRKLGTSKNLWHLSV